jgi:hypothetical protein
LVDNADITVWLMFAPFWLLGIAALAGAVWHMIHFVIVHARAQAAGHVPQSHGRKISIFSRRRLKWHELSHDGRHHLKWSLIAMGTFIGLCVGGVVVGAVAALLMRV